jgi:hypothetical protein
VLRARVVDDESRFEVVQSVKDQIDAVQILFDIRRIYIVDSSLDLNRRIDSAQPGFRCYCFGKITGNVAFIEERLPLQIRKLYKIAIDQPDETNSGTYQLVCSDGSKGAEADKKNTRFRQPLLAGFAYRTETNLA